MAFELQQPNTSRLGMVQTMTMRVTFADDGVAASFTPIPGKCQIIDTWREVLVVFDDSGTDVLEVGTAADPDHFADTGDTTLTATGIYQNSVAANTPEMQLTSTTIQVLYTGQNSDSTTGECDVHVQFVMLPDAP